MKERKIMGRDSSGGVGELILGLVLLVVGGAMLKEIIENRTSLDDSIDSDSPNLEKTPEIKTPKTETPSLNKQLTYRKTQNKVIDVRKVVRPNPLPYHLEKGWQKIGRVHHGYYRCRLGAFKGEIEESPGGDYKFYIFDPPQKIFTGSHKDCFTNNGGNRYHVHFGVNSENLDSGIMAVERLLYQSLKRR